MNEESSDFNAEKLSEQGIDRQHEYLENVEYDENGDPLEDIDEYFENLED